MLVLNLGRRAPFATSCMVGSEDKRTNNRTMFPTLRLIMRLQVHSLLRSRGLGSSRNAAAKEITCYKDTVKIDLLKGRVLLLNFKYVDELLRCDHA